MLLLFMLSTYTQLFPVFVALKFYFPIPFLLSIRNLHRSPKFPTYYFPLPPFTSYCYFHFSYPHLASSSSSTFYLTSHLLHFHSHSTVTFPRLAKMLAEVRTVLPEMLAEVRKCKGKLAGVRRGSRKF